MPLAQYLRDSLITHMNLARRVTFFSKMAFGECWLVWQVPKISGKGHFDKGEYSPKIDIFCQVLALAKFAREWPLLS